MKKVLTLLILLLCATMAKAEIRLSPLFSDNMVLQQKTEAPIWGKAEPGATVSVKVSWIRKPIETKADDGGNWRVLVTTPKASFKKHTVTISDGTPVTLNNVLIGEVWFCSGQSNMEMPVESWDEKKINQDVIAAAGSKPYIRLLYVDRGIAREPQENFVALHGGWTESSPETVKEFSATAYFFGQNIQKALNVPVGLINSSWGGTIIEAWTGRNTLEAFPDLRQEMRELDDMPASMEEQETIYRAKMEVYKANVNRADHGYEGPVPVWAQVETDSTGWIVTNMPGKIQNEYPGKNGIFWFRKEVEIPKDWEGRELTLFLGGIDDCDDTYFNGKLVGTCDIYNQPREYRIPAELVHTGKALIAVRNIDTGGEGGMTGSARMRLQTADGESLPLEGEWLCRHSLDLDQMPKAPKTPTDNPNLVTVLYNAMVVPVAPYAIKGALWYQGESNESEAERYREYLPAMITDWRNLWGYDFPFYVVQLASFRAVQPSTEVVGTYPGIREAQAMAAGNVAACDYAVLIDIGEADDIHPKSKPEVGRRLALLALAHDYDKSIEYSGPRMTSCEFDGNSARVTFDHIADGLKVMSSGDYASTRYGSAVESSRLVKDAETGVLTGFEVAGADHVFHWADAIIDGNEVIVSSAEVAMPVAVRYGWADNPVCNLYNSEGLPAAPFRTDDWK